MLDYFRWAIAAKEISDLWMEYEENSSLEAKVVKDFDKVLFLYKIAIHGWLKDVHSIAQLLWCNAICDSYLFR